jgi:hypothetical protein
MAVKRPLRIVACADERTVAALQDDPAGLEDRPLTPAWDGVITCHLLPDHVDLSDADFEAVLDQAREVLAAGLLAGQHEGGGR